VVVGQRIRRLSEREIETPFAFLIEQPARAVECQLKSISLNAARNSAKEAGRSTNGARL